MDYLHKYDELNVKFDIVCVTEDIRLSNAILKDDKNTSGATF